MLVALPAAHENRSTCVRLTVVSAALVLALGLAQDARAQDARLPDIGSSAGELLSPEEEVQYGAYTLFALRRAGYVLEDPLVDSWLESMGHRLAAASDRPMQHFTFFMIRDRQINAFATLGGYIGVNAGTVLAAESEDEVAGVVAHEVSHVTQRHVLRAVERAKKDQLPILLATLGVIIAAQGQSTNERTGHNSGDDAIQAAVIGGQALAAQRQINYTRSSESEADRVGIQKLHQAGYHADGMADFFARMERLTRGDSGGDQAPAYLQTHPITTTRISEARERARRLESAPSAPTGRVVTSGNPLLQFPLATAAAPGGAAQPAPEPIRMFPWARERLRVLSAPTPAVALRETRLRVDQAGAEVDDPRRYGLALANLKAGYPAAAEAQLEALAKRNPSNLWIGLAQAETAYAARDGKLARRRYEDLLAQHPQDRAVSLGYAETLNALGDREDGRRAQELLRPLLADNSDNPLFQRTYARAAELAGDIPRAGEAYAEAAYLNGRAEDALNQLTALLKRGDLDYVQRARIEARIAAITPEVLELRRRKIHPQDLPADG